MQNHLKSCSRALATCLEVAISVVGVVMLLSFPAGASHRFDEHFRANEIRRSIVRHSVVAGPEADGAQTITRIDIEPAIPMPVIAESAVRPLTGIEVSAQVSLIRLLQRFKLGPSRSSGPDLLL
jgi:hypothetical protein